MKMLVQAALTTLLLSTLLTAAEPRVQLVEESKSVKILIGDDVFTVFFHGADRKKPFFQPVTGPNGFELLQQAVAADEKTGFSRKVFVCSDTASMHDAGETSAAAHYGDILQVERIDGNQLTIAGRSGWIARQDVAPLAAVVTRLINDETNSPKDILSGDTYDHPHHKGIWFSVDEIDEIKFWVEKGVIQNQSVKAEAAAGNSATLQIVNHWLGENGEPVLIETSQVTIFPNRLLIYDATLTSAKASVEIGDTKEGMFAIRLAGSLRELGGGGPVTTSTELTGTKAAWGKPAQWVNYDGSLNGHVFGVTLMDATSNPWPSRYHVRDYGLFSINPFGEGSYTSGFDEPQPRHHKELKQGESLRFRYAAWVHGSNTTREQIQAAYQQFERAVSK